MKPDDPNNRRLGTPLVPERQLLRPSGTDSRAQTTEAAANILRGQINTIYDSPSHTPQSQSATPTVAPVNTPSTEQQPSSVSTNPYKRTHENAHAIPAEQWKQYHSAWQEYYQKYYERYYVNEIHRTKQALETQTTSTPTTSSTQAQEVSQDRALSKDEAMFTLRNDLFAKIQGSAKKVRKSRHFIPITAALCVMVVFLFLQYNRVVFSNVEAYVSPGNINPANIIVDPVTEVPVSAEPKLIVPKINVDVPIIFATTPDQPSQLKAMERGVAWFGIPGANSKPGQVGNTVLSGHSSNDVVDTGSYKFIFARLEQLTEGDTIYVNYEGKRYTYIITKKEVVRPTEVSKLIYPTDKPMLTLITCTPLGTALNRLLVTAEQVSPDPKAAIKAPESSEQSSSANMPGNSPTFIQRIFGATSQ